MILGSPGLLKGNRNTLFLVTTLYNPWYISYHTYIIRWYPFMDIPFPLVMANDVPIHLYMRPLCWSYLQRGKKDFLLYQIGMILELCDKPRARDELGDVSET